MSAVTDLRALLLADAAVAALVGTRISADRITQGAGRPFIVFARTDTKRDKTLDGSVVSVLVSFDVQCWADTRLVADQVADAVQAAIERADQDISSRSSVYEDDLDFEGESLAVDWWDE